MCFLSLPQVLGFILVILCFSDVFFTVWEKSQGIPRTPALFISPAVVGITVVIPSLFVCTWPSLALLGQSLYFPWFLLSLRTNLADWSRSLGMHFLCDISGGWSWGRAHLAGAEVSAGFRKRSHNKRISFLITTVCDLVWFRMKCDFCSINKYLSSPSFIASS